MGRARGVRLTAVVVTWRAREHLGACLDALSAAGPDEVVVVDNGSTDGTAELLAGRRDVRVVSSPVNLGFAGGANLGIRAATDADLVLLVNDDAVVAPDVIAALRDAVAADTTGDVAAWTARLLLPGSPALINSTGTVVLKDGRGADRDWLREDDGVAAAPDVFGFCGAAALLRRAALEAVGLFDEGFFMYYEDVDLSWRLRLAGWQVRHVDAAHVVHAHAQSSRAGSPAFLFHNFRNRLLCLVKNAPAPLAVREAFRLLGQALVAPVCGRALRATTGVRWRAWVSFLRLLPDALRERRAIGGRARVTRAEVAALLTTVDESRVGTHLRDE